MAGPEIRPRLRWYLLPPGLLLGSLGVGIGVFWLVAEPVLATHEGSPLRILVGLVLLIAVVGCGFLAAVATGVVVALRRARAKRDAGVG